VGRRERARAREAREERRREDKSLTPAEEWNTIWGALGDIGGATVAKWGTIGLDQEQISQLPGTPVVNELNVTDCTTLPKEYTAFAKEKGIQLWASGGGAGPGE
jgi:hypothetical protein